MSSTTPAGDPPTGAGAYGGTPADPTFPNPYGGAPTPVAATGPYGGAPADPASPFAAPALRHPGPLRPPAAGYPGQHPVPVAVHPGYPSYPGHPGYPPPAHGLPSLASWGLRVGAHLLDTLLVVVPYYGLLGLALVNSEPGYDVTGAPTRVPTPLGVLFFVLALVLVTAYWVWNRGYLQGRTGATLAKRWLGLRVVDQHTLQPLGMGRSLLRDLAHVLDGWSLNIGYLWPLWDDRRQTFADKVVGTVVVEA
ncbi:RDD family protein [Cellulomonas cellasea]|uniref:Putative RDD family membrane protein YckC n=1 Tax=Cellulomonas cellasea TaxID=43670 RepID=A0A7W4UIV5_9CELL|nr:RDD family protein [Cellulomonas cellasea]MBB2924972.1 putative RDD family membrane protein YckC [Cellulomonas cellasea]